MGGEERLRPSGRWDPLWRGSFEYDHGGVHYVVDVDYFDLKERVRLYADGELIDTRRSPALFVLDDGTEIGAALSTYGMRYVRSRTGPDEEWRDLAPRRGTGEAWRARIDRDHPAASRSVAALSWTVLAVAALTQVPALLNSSIGHLVDLHLPTPDLPTWANVLLGTAGICAAVERALRLKHDPWLDD